MEATHFKTDLLVLIKSWYRMSNVPLPIFSLLYVPRRPSHLLRLFFSL
jgi:hypothetical protein